MIDWAHPELSVVRQCKLLVTNRSGLYYRSQPESEENLALMRVIDEQYLKTLFYGSRQMRNHLQRRPPDQPQAGTTPDSPNGGLRAVAPGPHTSAPHSQHKVYPYLLRGMAVDRPNQVWATDISCILMARSFMYLVAVMDWATRKVLSWRVSNTMDTFCVEALKDALLRYGVPEIFNSDQGSQFTNEQLSAVLGEHDVRFSMDRRRCCYDNIFVQRLWWSVKYECVYLKAFDDGRQLLDALGEYFDWYNRERPHKALGNEGPDDVYFDSQQNPLAA